MAVSTQARKIAQIFNDDSLQPIELAEQVEILLSYTGYHRLMYWAHWVKYRRTGSLESFPEFLREPEYDLV